MTNTPDLKLTGSLLVAQFNEMVATATDLGLTGYREVNRFATAAAGQERTRKLHAAIQAAALPTSDPEVVEAQTGLHPLDQGDQSHLADDTVNHASAPAEETTTEAVASEETQEDEPELERLPDEEEEAYMARKAVAKKSKKKALAPKRKAPTKVKSSDGSTIREKTDEYNAIVAKMTKAQKEAAPFAKHHTSNFESQVKADLQLKKLKDAIKKA